MIVPIKTFEEMDKDEQRLFIQDMIEEDTSGNISPKAFLDEAAKLFDRVRTPRNDQNYFDVPDLVKLWPYKRSMIYKVLLQKAEEEKITLVGLEREKIDTTKRFKRQYTRFWISRRDKEKLERELGIRA